VNKIAKIGMLGWTILCFMGSCTGMVNIANQTQGRELGGAESVGVGIGLFMWLIIWAVPMVIMGIVALVTKPRTPPAVVAAQPGPVTLCSNCGKYFAGTARFCPLCGKSQSLSTQDTHSL
jgi:hypothetical protein